LAVQPGICENSREAARTMRELDHPAVRVHFDTGRYLSYNPSASGEVHLQYVSPWLASLQLTDHDGTPGNAELPPLGQGGAVDFARTYEIAKALTFPGPCVVEFRPRTSRPPSLDQCRTWLEDSLQLLRRGGWFDS
jgi:inosose dehydratase